MSTPGAEVDLPRLLRGAATGLVALVAVIVALGALVREPLAALAAALVERWGVPGVFAAVVALDALPGPGAQPALFFGWIGGVGFWLLVLVGGVGGVVAGGLGWAVGRALRGSPWLLVRLERFGVVSFLRRWGAAAVFVGAAIPFPYALCTIAAGACGVPLGATLLGATGRFVKAAVNLAIIVGAWGFVP